MDPGDLRCFFDPSGALRPNAPKELGEHVRAGRHSADVYARIINVMIGWPMPFPGICREECLEPVQELMTKISDETLARWGAPTVDSRIAQLRALQAYARDERLRRDRQQ